MTLRVERQFIWCLAATTRPFLARYRTWFSLMSLSFPRLLLLRLGACLIVSCWEGTKLEMTATGLHVHHQDHLISIHDLRILTVTLILINVIGFAI